MNLSPQSVDNDFHTHGKKRRIYQEEAKTRQTTHWDWDYLPLSTLERIARPDKPTPKNGPPQPERRRRIKTGLACILAGTLLMAALLGLILIDLRAV
ncbi:MAG: hypothetical protein QNI85_01660 [Desulfobacterales bacterium]|nr:hypothetical protein [Desulfobacterales bacterium]